MNTKISLSTLLLMVGLMLSQAQENSDNTFKQLTDQILIDAPVVQVWNVLSRFQDVGEIHPLIEESVALGKRSEEIEVGLQREIMVPRGMINTIYKQEVMSFVPFERLELQVYKAENIPIRTMNISYEIIPHGQDQTLLQRVSSYDLKSNWLNHRWKHRLEDANFEDLLAYKYFIETAGLKAEAKVLKVWYSKQNKNRKADDLVVSN